MLGNNSGKVSLLLKRKNRQITEVLQVGSALHHEVLQYYYLTPPELQMPVGKLNAAKETIATLKSS
jgi:hypothetical protein